MPSTNYQYISRDGDYPVSYGGYMKTEHQMMDYADKMISEYDKNQTIKMNSGSDYDPIKLLDISCQASI